MANIVAQGQLTIVDMHDMPPVTARLSSNQPKSVVTSSDGKTQTPDWSTNNLVVTVELNKAGNPNDLISTADPEIQGITWYITQVGSSETTTMPSGVTAGKTNSEVKFNNKLTVNQKLLSSSKTALKFRAEVSYCYPGTTAALPISAEIDFAISNNGVAGVDSYSAVLTNTSHSFSTNVSGAVSGDQETPVSAVIYKGGSPISSITLVGKSGQTLPDGMTIVADSAGTVKVKVANGKTLGGVDNGIIYLTATGDGQSFNLAFSWGKNKQGSAGLDSTSYWSIPSANAVVKKWKATDTSTGAFVLDPASISVKAKSQKGTANAADYNARFKFQLYDGTTALTGGTNESTSSADEASRSYSPPAGTKFSHIKVTTYKAGGTTVVLDEEMISLIEEPKKPVSIEVSTESNTIRNNAGQAILNVKVYKDGVDVTSTATKKWMKGTSTTSIGSGSTYTVTAAAVASSEIFKCQATVDGTNYIDSIVIYDTSDPIQTSIKSTNGDTFKNGVGTTVLSCELWRNSEILDGSGNKYMYCWHKMNKDGTEDTNWAPTAAVTAVSTNVSPAIAKVTTATSTTAVVLDDVTFIRKGYLIFFGTDTTVYTVSAVNTSSKQITLNKTPTTAIAANTVVKVANYKKITVTDSHVDDKATFICELVE